jgi:FkbM family methyltransferase
VLSTFEPAIRARTAHLSPLFTPRLGRASISFVDRREIGRVRRRADFARRVSITSAPNISREWRMNVPWAIEGMSWVTRNFPSLPGRWRLVRWLESNERQFAAIPPKIVRFAGRFRMSVDPVDENGRRYYINGYMPRERLTRIFARLLRPGDCVLDVGANVGYYTLAAAKLVGPTGCVHAFEASPLIFSRLKRNARLNPHANIHVHHAAVADRPGEVAFHTAAADRTGYSSIRDLGADTASVATVPALAIDSLLPELPPARLVKIDVEGAELLVLRGMCGLLERDRPHLICEVDDGFLQALGADAERLCRFLRDAEYDLQRIGARSELTPVTDAPRDRCNLLASPRGRARPG